MALALNNLKRVDMSLNKETNQQLKCENGIADKQEQRNRNRKVNNFA